MDNKLTEEGGDYQNSTWPLYFGFRLGIFCARQGDITGKPTIVLGQ